MRNRQDTWVRRTILALGALVILLCIIVPYWGRRVHSPDIAQDRAGAAAQEGVATIVALVGQGETMMANPIDKQQALVRFQGKLYGVKNVVGFQDLKVDRSAQIIYRVGKSGRIYVDSVAPLPANAPPSP